MPDYYRSTLIVCPLCHWHEILPARRKLPERLEMRAGAAFQAHQKHEILAEEAIEKLRALSQERFERFCADLFGLLGYVVTVAEQDHEKSHDLELRVGDELTLATCRCYAEYRKVDREEVENLAGDVRRQGAAHGVFVTTSAFTEECGECAKRSGIDLVDGEELRKKLESVSLESLETWLQPTPDAAPDSPDSPDSHD